MKQKIIDAIRDAMAYDRTRGTKMTRILNAEYALGQFHTLMELLFDIDIESWLSLADEYKDARNDLLKIAEQAYTK